MRGLVLLSILLVLVTVAAYWPVRHAEFTNFDDPVYVTNNEHVFHGLSRQSIRWAFTTIHGSNWHPLTWLSHMADCQVFGEWAGGHHLVNVGFHAANAVLLLLLLTKLTGAVWRSTMVAGLFALHPLHVESVAWISERKDVLSTFFGLLSLLAYARYAKVPSPRSKASTPPASGTVSAASCLGLPFYLLSLLFFSLGLLSKPMLVTFPFLMLLLDYWPLGRWASPAAQALTPTQHGTLNTQHAPGFRLQPLAFSLLEKLPFLALSAASCVVTFWAQKTGGAVVTMQRMSVSDRLINASASYVEYLAKTFWPARLAAYYPFASSPPTDEAVLGAALLVGLTALCLVLARRAPYFAVGWLWFVGTLVPVIGLVQVGSQAMADRYTYVPLVGLFVAVVWGASEAAGAWPWRRPALAVAGVGVLAACFCCTRIQGGYWRNTIALFTHTVQVTGDNALAQHNLGHALSHAGRQEEAIQHLNEAIRIKPGYPQAYFNRGNAYGVQGQVEQAIADYRQAIHFKPDYEQAYYNLGKGLALEGKLDEACTNFMAALRCKPDYAEAHTKLGNALVLEGRLDQALPHLREAVRIQPDYDEGQYYLGAALARQRHYAEAVTCLRTATRLNPSYASALNDLAWLLATCPDPKLRNVPEAVTLARKACKLSSDADPMYLDTLGVAESESGQFKEAIARTEKAIQEAKQADNSALAAQLETHLAAYRGGSSYTRAFSEVPRL
ncbi:MAG TPA: tetratricopeptide repeat protein [Candidatus Acidoferrum sp.]|nr:tetratricopeptide repeat protein [Candidatus Acidoferrum sp.]